MSKPGEFWIFDINHIDVWENKPDQEWFDKNGPGIHVIEKSAADKLAEALEWIVDLQDPKKNDLSYEDTKYTEAEIAEKALKQYKGKDISNKEETSE